MAAVLPALLDDLAAETAALDAVLVPLRPEEWARQTPAAGWNIADQVSHLAYFDETALLAAVRVVSSTTWLPSNARTRRGAGSMWPAGTIIWGSHGPRASPVASARARRERPPRQGALPAVPRTGAGMTAMLRETGGHEVATAAPGRKVARAARWPSFRPPICAGPACRGPRS